MYFNDHVIYFGGGALTSSDTRILSIKSLNKLLEEERKEEEGGVLSVLYDESDPTAIFQPTLLPRSNNYPPARLDGKAVTIGSQMIIFGGFSRRSRELGDFWVRITLLKLPWVDFLFLFCFPFLVSRFESRHEGF